MYRVLHNPAETKLRCGMSVQSGGATVLRPPPTFVDVLLRIQQTKNLFFSYSPTPLSLAPFPVRAWDRRLHSLPSLIG